MSPRSRIILLAFFSLIPLMASAQSGYHLIKKYPLTGDGGWDYVAYDDHAKRVYISHATHVLVFDAAKEMIIGDINNTEGVHGIAFAQEFNHGFTSNGKSNSVLMFDLKSLDTLKRISVGTKPDAIIYEPFSKCIIVCNGGSNNASVIDAKTGTVKKTISLGGAPEFAVSDGKGRLYINLEDKSEVTEIDVNKFKVLHHWKLIPGEGPTGIAMDTKTHRLFIGCANELMMIVSADNGKIITKLPIGKHVDAVVFDPEKNLAISSNGEGTMTVVHETSPDKFEVQETVKTQPGAKTEALDPDSHNIYLITADFGPAPEATKEHPHPRGAVIPNSFTLLKYGN